MAGASLKTNGTLINLYLTKATNKADFDFYSLSNAMSKYSLLWLSTEKGCRLVGQNLFHSEERVGAYDTISVPFLDMNLDANSFGCL